MVSCSFTVQLLARLGLLKNFVDESDVYLLTGQLDEQVATLHLPALGAALAVRTVSTQEQADYTGVKVERPFKGRWSSMRKWRTTFLHFVQRDRVGRLRELVRSKIPAHVYILPQELYVKGANLHFPALREESTVLTHYRY